MIAVQRQRHGTSTQGTDTSKAANGHAHQRTLADPTANGLLLGSVLSPRAVTRRATDTLLIDFDSLSRSMTWNTPFEKAVPA